MHEHDRRRVDGAAVREAAVAHGDALREKAVAHARSVGARAVGEHVDVVTATVPETRVASAQTVVAGTPEMQRAPEESPDAPSTETAAV